jgi:hypothetical protein
MFIKSRVLYIVGNHAGDSLAIDEDLIEIGIKNRFFNKNPNILSTNAYSNFLNKLPSETVFSVSLKAENNNNNEHEFYISIPFISSHLGLPVKVNEIIWLQEIDSVSNTERFYDINSCYLGRAHSFLTTEDAGYCYHDREDKIFKVDRKNFNHSRTEKSKDAKQRLESMKNASINTSSIFEHLTVNDSSELNFIKNKNIYLKDKIKNYAINPSAKFNKNPEDLVVKGTYNNLICLNNEIDSITKSNRYGSIDLIAGHSQYASVSPPEEFSFDSIDFKNNRRAEKIRVNKHNVDLLGVQLWNGTHYETVKSSLSFANEGFFKELKFDEFDQNVLKDKSERNKNYTFDAACLTISEYNEKSIEIQKNNLLTMNDINERYLEFGLPSNLKDQGKFFNITTSSINPDISKNLLDAFLGGSNITGIADSIVLSTHLGTYSENNNIKLIQVNSNDRYSSQISLNNSGNILLDGHKILIGSYERLEKKENGRSALVYLGHSNEAQSLVLGEQLKAYLEEMLDVSREDMEITKNLFLNTKNSISNNNQILVDEFKLNSNKTLNNITNSLTSVLPLGAMPVVEGNILVAQLSTIYATMTGLVIDIQNAIDAFSQQSTEIQNSLEEAINNKKLKREEELSLRLETIEKNINKILSKFAKTS